MKINAVFLHTLSLMPLLTGGSKFFQSLLKRLSSHPKDRIKPCKVAESLETERFKGSKVRKIRKVLKRSDRLITTDFLLKS